MVVLALGGGIVADQLALVPKFQQYASNFDARHAEIIAQIEEGKRRISIVPLSFDLEPYLKVARLHSHRCPLQYYEVDAIVIETP